MVGLLSACNGTAKPNPSSVPTQSPSPSPETAGGAATVQPESVQITYDSAENTLALSGRGVLALHDLPALLPQAQAPTVLTQTIKGEWLLAANLRINPGVTLTVAGPQVSWLKMRSDSGGFVWLKAMGGGLDIHDTKITSWDAGENDVDIVLDDGRAFVLARSKGRMDIRKSELSDLGYEANESYGVAWRNVGTTGSAVDSVFAENFYGLYLHEASDVVIRGNTVRDNYRYGIDPHSRSNRLVIENNVSRGNGKQGIILAEGCSDSVIRGNTVFDNDMHGIVIFNNSDNNVIEGNVAYDNGQQGINIKNSQGNTIRNNEVYGNGESGIGLGEDARNNQVLNNTVRDNKENGIYAYSGATGNQIGGNQVYGNAQNGIYIKSEGNTLLDGNSVHGNAVGVLLRVPIADQQFKETNKIFDNREEDIRVRP